MLAQPSPERFDPLPPSSDRRLVKLPPGVFAGGVAADAVPPLPTGVAPLDELLPDGGLPRGAVVELAAPRGLGLATSVALRACAAAQAEARRRGTTHTAGAWCAWVEPSAALFAPAAERLGVDLTRLLVVLPPLDALARVAVRVAASRALSVVVVDTVGLPGQAALGHEGRQAGQAALGRWANVVRRLALAVEGGDTTVVLLTDRDAARSAPLPVALRLELERPSYERVAVRVAKERRGRVASAAPISAALLARGIEAPAPRPLVAVVPRPLRQLRVSA